MSRPAAVRVLPSSRPVSRTWLVTPASPIVPEPYDAPAAPAVRGRVVRAGRPWAATVPAEVPDPARWTGWLALALGEALLGRRPASRLVDWVGDDVLAGLRRRQRLQTAVVAAPRTVLLSGRVQHPAYGVAEASAVLRCGPRLLVLAFRLEAQGHRWVCTALEAGFTPAGASRRSRAQPAAAAPVPVAGTR